MELSVPNIQIFESAIFLGFANLFKSFIWSDMDMEGFLVVLPDAVVDASKLIKRPCSMRDSSFTVQKINGSPQTPYDYQPSTYLPETDSKVANASENSDKKLAFSTCKHFW